MHLLYCVSFAHCDITVLSFLAYPKRPQIERCIVYGFETMNCTWSPTADEQREHTGLEVNQTLYWVLRWVQHFPFTTNLIHCIISLLSRSKPFCNTHSRRSCRCAPQSKLFSSNAHSNLIGSALFCDLFEQENVNIQSVHFTLFILCHSLTDQY